MIEYLFKHQMITNREASILMPVVTSAYENMEPEERVQLLHTLLLTLERMA
jgi:transcriptional regulator CtsR